MCLGLSTIAPRVTGQFLSGVDLVEVYATATDAQGEPVLGLTREDFVVEEDGERQTIRAFTAGEFPLALAIGIDRSFSMSRAGLAGVSSAVRGLLAELRPDDQAMLVAIGSQTEVLAPLAVDRAPALARLNDLEPWGTTPLYDAALAAVDAIEASSGRRALILISDGTDRYSETPATELIDRVRRKNVLIYPVALSKVRPPVFAELATVTGGRSFQVDDVRKLPVTLSAIGRELRYQYLIGYAPPARADTDGGWRSIRVTVNRPNVRVRARDGYVLR